MSLNQPKQIPDSLEAMRKFSEVYAERTGTFFCIDSSVTAVVIEGLAKHKDLYGSPLCPCRHYENKVIEVQSAYWNCPCVPMRERKECHCMLFLKPDNEFAGSTNNIDNSEIFSHIL
uniref:Ferredoxin-thioredoxin reductase, catalytic chain n=1 Tax=Corallina ferreyrae TaxID=2547422 RepID=A0A482CH56_9FLOR|nr:ferredoxin-thioredoxin reductase beta subunit [Corallina ferreyrae]QBL75754.1 ferredoxin-thioredoxin reductase beta subunit [Corallina ferreyrae]